MSLLDSLFPKPKPQLPTSINVVQAENSVLKKRLMALSEINQAIVGVVDQKKVLDLITSKLVSVIGVSYATIFVWDDKDQTLSVGSITIPKTVSVLSEKALGNPIKTFKLSANNPEHQNNDYIRAIVENQTLETNDLHNLSKPFVDKTAASIIQGLLHMKLAVSIPLVAQDKKLGVLGIIWHEDSFTQEDRSLIDTFANQISTTLYNAELFERVNDQITQLKSKNDELQSLYNLTNNISVTLDPYTVAQKAVNSIPMDDTMLASILDMYDKNTNTIYLSALSQHPLVDKARAILGDFTQYRSNITDPAMQHNVIVKAIVEKRMQVTQDLGDIMSPPIPQILVAPIKKLINVSSAVVFPLVSHNETVGAIVFLLQNKTYEQLEETKKQLLSTYALQIGIALENANLFSNLESALEELKEARRRERDMLDVMGHELRTPISIVRNALLMLDHDAKKSNGVINQELLRKYLDMAIESVRREITLIETLLSATKIDAARMQLFLSKVDMKDVVNDALEGQRLLLKDKKLEVAYQPPEGDVLAYADRTRAQEIMDNFLSNSIKYTNEGAVHITIWQDTNWCWVKLQDTGMGIAEDDLQNLGKKFFRAKQYIPTHDPKVGEFIRPGGTGLGLYVSFDLIRIMGGKLFINSRVGEGSIFTFCLPVYTNQTDKQIDETFSASSSSKREHVIINGEVPQPPK